MKVSLTPLKAIRGSMCMTDARSHPVNLVSTFNKLRGQELLLARCVASLTPLRSGNPLKSPIKVTVVPGGPSVTNVRVERQGSGRHRNQKCLKSETKWCSAREGRWTGTR